MPTNKRPFTDRWLHSLKPLRATDPEYRKPIWDAQIPGLCIRIGKHVEFYAVKRSKGGKLVWIKLGTFPILPLAEARTEAVRAVAVLGRGAPVTRQTTSMLTADAAELYLERVMAGKRSRIRIEQLFRNHILPAVGRIPLTELSHELLVTVLQNIARQSEIGPHGRRIAGGPHTAHHAHTYLHGMLRYCAHNRIGGLQTDPTAAISIREILRGHQITRTRDRVLDDGELRMLWRAAETMGYPNGTYVHAMVLTGLRRCELSNLRWDWLDEAETTFTIPAARMKNGLVHSLPVAPRFREVLASAPRYVDGPFVFSFSAGRTPYNNFSELKRRFERLLGDDVASFRLHDIRRTTRTNLSRAGVNTFYAELIIAHQQAGVHGVYDRWKYFKEKLDGLTRWENLLFDHVLPEPLANVVPLPERVA
jgi:integrase